MKDTTKHVQINCGNTPDKSCFPTKGAAKLYIKKNSYRIPDLAKVKIYHCSSCDQFHFTSNVVRSSIVKVKPSNGMILADRFKAFIKK